MDANGRAADNAIVERIFITIKREYIYLNLTSKGIKKWIRAIYSLFQHKKNKSRNRQKNTNKYF